MFLVKIAVLAQLLFTWPDTGRFSVKAVTPKLSDSTVVTVLPLPITRVIADLGGNCHMFMYSDSSFVLRTYQKADTSCQRKVSILPNGYVRNNGYYQRRADSICLLSERDLGCNFDEVMSIFTTFSNGWPSCNPYVSACGALTTVMDYNGVGKERYENGAYWCYNRGSYGPWDAFDNCMWSGWEYPLRGFPGRWETADNWLFFTRKSN